MGLILPLSGMLKATSGPPPITYIINHHFADTAQSGFDTFGDGSWTGYGGQLVRTGGQLEVTGGVLEQLSLTQAFTNGVEYEITYSVSDVTGSATPRWRIFGGGVQNGPNTTASGEITDTITMSADRTTFQFQSSTSAGRDWNIQWVRVRAL